MAGSARDVVHYIARSVGDLRYRSFDDSNNVYDGWERHSGSGLGEDRGR